MRHPETHEMECASNLELLEKPDKLLECRFKVPDGSLIHHLNEDESVLLVPKAAGAWEYVLSDFSKEVMSQFLVPRSIEEVLENVSQSFKVSLSEKDSLRDLVKQQVMEALAVGILYQHHDETISIERC